MPSCGQLCKPDRANKVTREESTRVWRPPIFIFCQVQMPIPRDDLFLSFCILLQDFANNNKCHVNLLKHLERFLSNYFSTVRIVSQCLRAGKSFSLKLKIKRKELISMWLVSLFNPQVMCMNKMRIESRRRCADSQNSTPLM